MDHLIESPVLFLVFNRPEKTQRVFNIIRNVKPKKLYVAADGPREHVISDHDNCSKVRKIVSDIDWECESKFLFHEKNLGCSLAGKTSWDWIFSQEEEMIFIEDDGLISRSFFWFCQEMLIKYKDDLRIAYISGENFGPKYGNASYFFSRMGGGTYSSGTWKRVYELYDYKLESYNELKNRREFRNNFVDYFDYKLRTSMFDNYVNNDGNTYDLQMVYLVHRYNMYNIIPNINLCSNIGFDLEGSNTSMDPKSKLALKLGNRPRFEISTIVHPDRFEVSKKFEKDYFQVRVLYDEPRKSAILRFCNNHYGYPAWKRMVKRMLVNLRIRNNH